MSWHPITDPPPVGSKIIALYSLFEFWCEQRTYDQMRLVILDQIEAERTKS